MPSNQPNPSTLSTVKQRQPQLKQRRVPERTCIVCKQVRPKRELIRIVRTPENHVELDPTGKKSGRGAYLCARRSCWEPALHKGKLEHEFNLTLLPEDRIALEAYIETLPQETAKSTTLSPAGRAKKTASAQ